MHLTKESDMNERQRASIFAAELSTVHFANDVYPITRRSASGQLMPRQEAATAMRRTAITETGQNEQQLASDESELVACFPMQSHGTLRNDRAPACMRLSTAMAGLLRYVAIRGSLFIVATGKPVIGTSPFPVCRDLPARHGQCTACSFLNPKRGQGPLVQKRYC